MWEKSIDINKVVEIRAKTTDYLGVGAIHKINDVSDALLNKGIKKVIVVTGKGSHIKTGAWDVVKEAFDKKGIGYTLYSEVTPNPTVDQVDEATEQAVDFGAKAVIGIGGGSPIDTGKSVAIMMEYPNKNARDLYEFRFAPDKAAPIVAINLTHGTGTEVNRFAVVSVPEKEYKPAIAYDCIYPIYAINDPALTVMLPVKQTLYVTVDAINHIIEAATSKATNPFAILLAKETVRLVAKYLPIVKENPNDLTARYYLMYASMIAGTCFDNGLLHFTHALEHPLSGIKPELSHGLGLSMLLPAVIKQIYPVSGQVLADILSPIIPDLKGNTEETNTVFVKTREWLEGIGITAHLKDQGFAESDIDRLTDLAFETPSLDLLLSMAPIEATKETVRNIYKDSF